MQRTVSGGERGSERWKQPRPRSIVLFLLAILLGVVLLTTIPYHLPVHPSVSDSYGLGFSNRGALLLLLTMLALFGLWHGPIQKTEQPVNAPSTRLTGGVLLVCTVVLGATEWMVQACMGPRGEGQYFLDRLTHLASGERIYRDFEMAYGPLLLYLPLTLHRLLHMPLLQAYSLSLLVENVVGLGLLWYVVCSVAGNSAKKNWIFSVLAFTALAWLPLAPAQYTMLRYWIVPAGAILSFGMFKEGKHVRSVGALIVTFGCALLVAPEQAIGLLAGEWLFTLCFLPREWRSLAPGFLLFQATAAGMIVYAYKAGEFTTFLAFSNGAYAVPLAISPILILVLVLLAIAACGFVEAVRTKQEGGSRELLLCLAVCFLSVAFSRADAQHQLSNTFTAAVVAWTLAAQNTRLWRTLLGAYVLVVFVYPRQLPYANLREATFQQWLLAKPGDAWRTRPYIYSPNLTHPPTWNSPAAPYFVTSGRFFGLENVVLDSQVQEIIQELRERTRNGQPALVALDFCTWGDNPMSLAQFLGTPLVPQKQVSLTLPQPLCDEVHSDRYTVVDNPGIPVPAGAAVITSRRPQPLP